MARILLDGYNLGLAKGTGVATYARNLAKEVGALQHEVSVLYGKRFGDGGDPLVREVAFFDTMEKKPGKLAEALRVGKQALAGPLGHSPREIPLTGRVIARTFSASLPQASRFYNGSDLFRASAASFALWGNLSTVRLADRHDLAHWTYPLPVRLPDCPNIYTLHDLVPLRLPYTTLDNKKRYYNLLKKIVGKADHIVTVSECSRRDIIDLLGVSEDRITNTYQSVYLPAEMRRSDEAQLAAEVEGATGAGYKEYFLFWGSIEPKKNIDRMIEAYLASNLQTPLVIVGAQAWKAEDQLRLLKNESVRRNKHIIQLTYAPLAMLVSLIRGAKAALFPSLYEGFGLPVLEAMTLGTPVICADTASLPEVAGDAALLVDPYDPRAIAQALRRMDADEGLRADLSRRGLEQAQKFSPAAYQTRLDELYRKFV
jgi:glycosyltransferase involved in cell wall biosynthesis